MGAESTTGDVWTAGYGTGDVKTKVITDYRKVTEFRSWADARADMVSWMHEYAEEVDRILRIDQVAGRHLDLKVNCVEHVDQFLIDNPHQVDLDIHAWIDSWMPDPCMLFVVERDSY